MDWNKLLSTKRVSDFCDLSNDNESQFLDPRSPFERDCDQIFYSYPFRRLQDKTQVIPFPEFDFVHTRLTHSLEVSTIGRSLGKKAFRLIEPYITDNKVTASDIGALVAASCFAHDIGNPPFGHSGEASISVYFEDEPFTSGLEFADYYRYNHADADWEITIWDDGSSYPELALKNSKYYYDLCRYEGNANGFRILVNNCGRGINPTFALLGVFSKYPRESFVTEDLELSFKRKEAPKQFSKYGFFQIDKEIFKAVAEELGLIKISQLESDLAYCRHPLAYLMEAADDIAYQMIDFEDGCRLDIIHYHELYDGKSPKEMLIKIAKIDNRFSEEHLNLLCREGDHKNELAYLRSGVINVLTHLCYEVFEKNYVSIMDGKYDKSLIDDINNEEVNESLSFMKKLIRNKVYNYAPVLESEAGGFRVLGGLIRSFAQTAKICISCGDKKNAEEEKIESLIPQEYRTYNEATSGRIEPVEVYERYIKILDFISGMTDRYALDKYRKIHGIIVPGIR